MEIRKVRAADYAQWAALWAEYNAVDARMSSGAGSEVITAATWARFLDPVEPMWALLARVGDQPVGVAHYLFHRSTSRLGDVCCLQDLFVAPGYRRRGIGRRLIERVVDEARHAGSERVYWATRADNAGARALYDSVAGYRGLIIYSRLVEGLQGKG